MDEVPDITGLDKDNFEYSWDKYYITRDGMDEDVDPNEQQY